MTDWRAAYKGKMRRDRKPVPDPKPGEAPWRSLYEARTKPLEPGTYETRTKGSRAIETEDVENQDPGDHVQDPEPVETSQDPEESTVDEDELRARMTEYQEQIEQHGAESMPGVMAGVKLAEARSRLQSE